MRLAFILATALIVGCGTPKGPIADVPNLQVVDAGFYRSGQPNDAGFAWLLQHEHDWNGQFTILKLNTNEEGKDDAVKYSTGCYAHGCGIVYFPITMRQQLGIDTIDINLLACIISDFPHYGALIHCTHGQDRTGLAVAMHRVLVDHWTTTDAEKEMLADGFHKELAGLWYAWNQFKKSHE